MTREERQAAFLTPSSFQRSHFVEPALVRVEIAARHFLDPLTQGQLDGLCSLYAIINGFRLACAETAPFTRRQCKELFALGLAFLGRKGNLQKDAAEGLCRRRRQALAHHLAEVVSSPGREIVIERPDKEERGNVGDIFRWIAASLSQNKPVLVPLMGALNHLTVVWAISGDRIFLFDSGGRRYVRTSACDLKGGYHQIQAKGLLRVALKSRI